MGIWLGELNGQNIVYPPLTLLMIVWALQDWGRGRARRKWRNWLCALHLYNFFVFSSVERIYLNSVSYPNIITCQYHSALTKYPPLQFDDTFAKSLEHRADEAMSGISRPAWARHSSMDSSTAFEHLRTYTDWHYVVLVLGRVCVADWRAREG